MGFDTLTAAGAIKVTVGPSSATVTTTGTINDLDFSNADLIRMNNATDATIDGLLAGSDGQQVTIVSIGAGHVYLAHQNTGSAAANRLINFLTTFNTPLAAGVGTAILRYDATTARWRLIKHAQGKPITIAYVSGNYTASTGTWTVDSGDVTTETYFFDDRVCEFTAIIASTTVSATPTTLQITIPMTPLTSAFKPARQVDVVTGVIGMFRSVSGDPTIYCYKDATAGAWSTATNTTNVQGTIDFEVG